MDGNKLECARHPEEVVKIKLDTKVDKFDMMRTFIK